MTLITTWLAARRLGLSRGVWLLVLAAALTLAGLWLREREHANDRANQTIGAATERDRQARAALNNLEKADAAADHIRRDRDAALAECLRNARNPADC